MPTVNLNKKVFEKLVGKEFPLEELKDRISMLGTDLESIEGNDIIVEVFPNRPDMLSEQGFARAFSSFVNVKTGLRNFKVNDSDYKVIIDKSLKDIRPFTVCAVVKNINFDDEKIREIIQIQEKLHITQLRKRKKGAIGIYPFEKIKFPINFIAKKAEEIVFRPLDSPIELNGKQILEENSTGKEYKHLLEGKEKFPVFIDASGEILSMPPIINSHKIGRISEDTKSVFIEVSGFDFKTLSQTLSIIVANLSDMGGDIYSVVCDYGDKNIVTPNLSPKRLFFDRKYINKRLGLNLSSEEIDNLLFKMGFGVDGDEALIPSYRADILHQVDLCEDIAIAYGYENFEAEIPSVGTIGKENELEKRKGKIASMLVGLGMLEANTLNIVNEFDQTKKMLNEIPLIKLKNSLSKDYTALRAWMLPSLLEILTYNKHHEYPQKLFSFGSCFYEGESETGVIEKQKLAGIICGDNSGVTEIRQIIDYLFSSMGMNISVVEKDHPSFIGGRSGLILRNDKKIGFFGEVHPQVLENFGIMFPVSAFEIFIPL